MFGRELRERTAFCTPCRQTLASSSVILLPVTGFSLDALWVLPGPIQNPQPRPQPCWFPRRLCLVIPLMSGLPSSLPPSFLLSTPPPMRPSSILLLYGEVPAPAFRNPLTHCPEAWPCTWCGSHQPMTCESCYLVSPDYMQPP